VRSTSFTETFLYIMRIVRKEKANHFMNVQCDESKVVSVLN
jgi:hypothetical protein